MSDTQHDVRVDEESANSQTEESRSPQASGMTVARMLANPRRIRRA
jgi:hypothetical protein